MHLRIGRIRYAHCDFVEKKPIFQTFKVLDSKVDQVTKQEILYYFVKAMTFVFKRFDWSHIIIIGDVLRLLKCDRKTYIVNLMIIILRWLADKY